MILSAHQPAYLPWLGLFHKVAAADTFCIVDTVPFSRYDFINRNRIKTPAGPIWLTVPVSAPGAKRICDVRIAGTAWRRKHAMSLAQYYRKAEFFDEHAPGLSDLLGRPYVFLTELTTALLRLFVQSLGLQAKIVAASDYAFRGHKSEYVLDMCRTLGASAFLFGSMGKRYADTAAFTASGIDLYFQEYRHPRYRQLYGAFVPRLSIVDLLFNEGPRSLEVLLRGNEWYAKTAK